jgi:hypothetical protein
MAVAGEDCDTCRFESSTKKGKPALPRKTATKDGRRKISPTPRYGADLRTHHDNVHVPVGAIQEVGQPGMRRRCIGRAAARRQARSAYMYMYTAGQMAGWM